MVLEYILSFKENPKHLFISGFLYSTIAILLASAIFPRAPSMVVVTFMTLPSIYIFTKYFKELSLEELHSKSSWDIFRMNFKLAENYIYLFLGMSLGITVWFSVLPHEMLTNIFSEQIWNLEQLGRATNLVTGAATSGDILSQIMFNNIRLVTLCCIMSFVFGAGSLFILSWNASIIGVAIGSIVYRFRTAGTEFAFFSGVAMGISYFTLHLIPEVLAYFYGAIAGAFISTAMMRYKPFSEQSNKLLKIAAGLFLVAIGFIVIGAFIEVFISYNIQLFLR
jgi:uncharacterized membrane protein SpoIIM required for sporulation